MHYRSTRGVNKKDNGQPYGFEDVLMAGLAPDGGLFMPGHWPQFSYEQLREMAGKSYQENALDVMLPYVEGSLSEPEMKTLINETYSDEAFRTPEITPLKRIGDNLHVLELFHGPTIAFKDVALQFLGRLFDHVLAKRKHRITIVGATSGDTGSAAIEGCRGCDYVDVFILHPKGRVSDVQRRQMTTVEAANVFNIALEGTFDDCQNQVKDLFGDHDFRHSMNLSAINSINWARIMAQIVYYFKAALDCGAPDKDVSFVVPTGNFGNIFAAYAARRMGLPIKKLHIATNENDILTRFFQGGAMETRSVSPTLSPSMDIQISSNFERYLFELLDHDHETLVTIMKNFKENGHFDISQPFLDKARTEFSAKRTDDKRTLETIKNVQSDYGYTLDPHTAVGFAAAQDAAKEDKDIAVISLACAHPAKFPDAVEKATGQRPPLPGHLSDLFDRKERYDVLPDDFGALKDYIRGHARIAKEAA